MDLAYRNVRTFQAFQQSAMEIRYLASVIITNLQAGQSYYDAVEIPALKIAEAVARARAESFSEVIIVTTC